MDRYGREPLGAGLALQCPIAYSMSAYSRFEMFLPVRYSDGREVPRELVAEATSEIQRRFVGATPKSEVFEGGCRQRGVEYRGQVNRIFVDVEDTPENRRFFTELKARVKDGYEQLDIWVTSFPLEVL